MIPDCYDFYLWSIGELPNHLFDPYALIETQKERMKDL
jgi:hypothetical protein